MNNWQSIKWMYYNTAPASGAGSTSAWPLQYKILAEWAPLIRPAGCPPRGHETQNVLGESKGAEHFCLSGGSSVLSSRPSTTECKAFSALICPVRMTGLSETSPWLAGRDIQGLVHWGTTPPFTNLPPGLSSHVLSFPIMTVSGLACYTMPSRPCIHTEWSSEYNWFKFAKNMLVHYKMQLGFSWKKWKNSCHV